MLIPRLPEPSTWPWFHTQLCEPRECEPVCSGPPASQRGWEQQEQLPSLGGTGQAYLMALYLADRHGDIIRPLRKQVELLFNTRYGEHVNMAQTDWLPSPLPPSAPRGPGEGGTHAPLGTPSPRSHLWRCKHHCRMPAHTEMLTAAAPPNSRIPIYPTQ